MKDDNELKNENNKEVNKSLKKSLLSYDNDEQQTLFKIFGIEMTAPKGLKNPRVVYISFIVVNFILLILLKNLISS